MLATQLSNQIWSREKFQKRILNIFFLNYEATEQVIEYMKTKASTDLSDFNKILQKERSGW